MWQRMALTLSWMMGRKSSADMEAEHAPPQLNTLQEPEPPEPATKLALTLDGMMGRKRSADMEAEHAPSQSNNLQEPDPPKTCQAEHATASSSVPQTSQGSQIKRRRLLSRQEHAEQALVNWRCNGNCTRFPSPSECDGPSQLRGLRNSSSKGWQYWEVACQTTLDQDRDT